MTLVPSFAPLVKALLDELDEGVVLIDADDRIRLWNRAYADMLDVPRDLFAEGMEIRSLIAMLAKRGDYGPGDPTDVAGRVSASIRARKAVRGERQMVNGSIIHAEWSPLPDGCFLFRLRNVTSERTASQFKDELISTVSHELRTPLTVIVGALALLRAGVGQGEAANAELIDVAHNSGERLTRLVDDLLDVDKLQSDRSDFRFAAEDMAVLLSASIAENRPYAESLGVSIALEAPEGPVTAEVDRDRVFQLMRNLLSNAAKFSPTGSKVIVRLRIGADGVRISVIDEGRGISPDFSRRLFTRFAQENRASEHGETGTGLGLAICKAIVERHHGQIHADSREGVGTIFHVDLPYRQASEGG